MVRITVLLAAVLLALGACSSGEDAGREAVFGDGKVNVNAASARILMTLPGIGPHLADAIITLRQDRKKLHHLHELLEVKGIGKAKMAKIAGLVSFD